MSTVRISEPIRLCPVAIAASNPMPPVRFALFPRNLPRIPLKHDVDRVPPIPHRRTLPHSHFRPTAPVLLCPVSDHCLPAPQSDFCSPRCLFPRDLFQCSLASCTRTRVAVLVTYPPPTACDEWCQFAHSLGRIWVCQLSLYSVLHLAATVCPPALSLGRSRRPFLPGVSNGAFYAGAFGVVRTFSLQTPHAGVTGYQVTFDAGRPFWSTQSSSVRRLPSATRACSATHGPLWGRRLLLGTRYCADWRVLVRNE